MAPYNFANQLASRRWLRRDGLTKKGDEMCTAMVGNAGGLELRWKEALTRKGLDLWFVGGQETLVILADGVSCQEKEEALSIAQERGIPALCVNCEGAVLCRIMPVRDGTFCRSRADETVSDQSNLDPP